MRPDEASEAVELRLEQPAAAARDRVGSRKHRVGEPQSHGANLSRTLRRREGYASPRRKRLLVVEQDREWPVDKTDAGLSDVDPNCRHVITNVGVAERKERVGVHENDIRGHDRVIPDR